MYFLNQIKKIIGNIDLYVDMDGVIADYDVGKPLNFKNKRPLTNNIKVLEEVSKLPNVTMHILSICKKDFQIKEKNDWLDKYAPFFKKENRNILSKQSYTGIESKDLKTNFLMKALTLCNGKIVLVDDDNAILKQVMKNLDEIILFQDSALVD